MTILTRHLIRSLLGPFFFALVLLTGLLFIEVLARRLEEFVGKGLPAEVIAEAVLLMLPHTIALTLPMAMLVAVLYTYSDLAASGEIVAMAANGVRPRAMLLPAVACGVVAAATTYTFNDVILPEANHRLQGVLISIYQKSPTFHLRPKVFNEISPADARGSYFLRADSIDPVSNRLEGIVIHDMSRPAARGTIYAQRGEMQLNAQFTDLHLRLQEGEAYEVEKREPETLQRTEFRDRLYVLRNVGNVLQETEGARRSDREMSGAQLRQGMAESRERLAVLRAEEAESSRAAVEQALGVGPAADSLRAQAEARERDGAVRLMGGFDGLTRTSVETAQSRKASADFLQGRIRSYGAEMHKKLVLATVCVVFVLIGAPLGIRYPLGGVGMVILVSTAVFAVYQVGLQNGEDFADRGLASPFWAMWTTNVLFGALGVFMVTRVGRWVDAGRTGTLAHLRDSAVRIAAMLARRPRSAS